LIPTTNSLVNAREFVFNPTHANWRNEVLVFWQALDDDFVNRVLNFTKHPELSKNS
jgi:hypothetical protein